MGENHMLIELVKLAFNERRRAFEICRANRNNRTWENLLTADALYWRFVKIAMEEGVDPGVLGFVSTNDPAIARGKYR